MTHFDQIEVWQWTGEINESGGYNPTDPVRQTLAPTWATINQTSGNDLELNGRKATESVFDVIVNVRPGFTWNRVMFITTRFGNLDVIAISESLRKREITLTAARIEGISGSGTSGNIMTVYARSTEGATSITIPSLVGAEVILVFRHGINKEVVTETPSLVDQMQFDAGSGTWDLYPGDIFGDELITVLYRSTT